MNILREKAAVGTAHGKIILIGEHAAVYHKPAIALPCTAVQTTTRITPADKGIYLYCDLYCGLVDDMPELLQSLRTVIYATLYALKKENASLHIHIHSTIPIERGMGSSAAVSVSVIRALYHYFNRTLSDKLLTELSGIGEKIVHGNPSGLDATIVVKQHPILFKKNCPLIPLSIHLTGYLIVADTGITGQTKKAIQQVEQLYQYNPVQHHSLIEKLETLTHQAAKDLTHGNLYQLGARLNKAHGCLQQLGVSHERLDQLVTVALDHQALGAKLTGGGLGGCMIALTDTLEHAQYIAKALEQHGAKQTYIQAL